MFSKLLALSSAALMVSAAAVSSAVSVTASSSNVTSVFSSVLPTATQPTSLPPFNNSVIVPIGNGVYSCFAIPSAVPTIIPEPFPVTSSTFTEPVTITSSVVPSEGATTSFARRQEATTEISVSSAPTTSVDGTDTFVSSSPTTVATATASSSDDTALPTYVCVPIPQVSATVTGTAISSSYATGTVIASSSFASVSAF
ncbi:hypothetical protein AB1N83_009195 [Pleurotus pulmonarius]